MFLVLILAALMCTPLLLIRFMETDARRSAAATPIGHADAGIVLQRLHRVGRLHVLDQPAIQVVHARSDGRLGGTRCTAVVRGTARIGVDLTDAEVESYDSEDRCLVLRLPPPEVFGVEIDPQSVHADTLLVQRTGLWRLVPGPAREAETLAAALSTAQQRLAEAATPTLGTLPDATEPVARHHARLLLDRLLEPLNVELDVVWSDTPLEEPVVRRVVAAVRPAATAAATP